MRHPCAASLACIVALLALVSVGAAQQAQQWWTLGHDYAHTRYTPAREIDASDFNDLEVVWQWDGARFGETSGRATRRGAGSA